MRSDWPTRPLSDYVKPRPGNNKIIKGKQSDKPGDGLVQAYSASGPDVWVTVADYNQPGVVISAVGARCGKTFIADGEWTAIANTQVLLPGKGIDPRWLWYRTNDEDFWIRGGTAQPFVKVRETLELPCLVPPLPEQQRIVALLDEAFAGLATAKANAERNLQNANAIFESHLEAVFSQRGEGSVETTLGEIGKVCMCKRIFKEETTAQGDIPFFKIGTFGKEPDAFIPIHIYNEYRTSYPFPKKGAVLVSASGTIGRRVRYDGEPAYFQDSNIVWIDNNESQVLNSYLYHFYGACAWNSTSGATISRLYNDNLRRISIRFPSSLHEQGLIVSQLDDLAEETQHLTRLYERKLAALEELKKSLLHQAFNGEL